jgi:hypothetical protein
LLPSDFACVGLSDEFGVDHWGLKIVKLVAFPDLISSPKTSQYTISSDSSILPISPLTSAPIFEFIPPAADYSDSSSSSSNDDDGYFSHSPQSLSYESLTKPAFRSSSSLTKSTKSSPHRPPSKHLVSSMIGSVTMPNRSPRPSTGEPQAPFFSYTRTPEGSSLTADVYILATLFPPNERHMVICSGELDAADHRLLSGTESDDDYEDQEQGTSYLGNSLKCLQVDLRKFGLGE